MNLLDLTIVGVLLLAALIGLRTGLLRPGLGWLGVAAGQFAAVRLTPWVLDRTEERVADTHTLVHPLGVSAGVLVAGAIAGYVAGQLLGRLLHLALPGPLRTADRIAGCVAAAAAAGTIIWLLLPMAAATPGWFATQAADSRLTNLALEALPTPPDVFVRGISWLRYTPS